MTRVVLHVGLPKTGTTYLQAVLAHHRDALREIGVLYPFVRPQAMFLGAVEVRGSREKFGLTADDVAGTWQATSWLLDPEVDALLDKGRNTIDPAARAVIYNAVRQKIIDLQPTIYGFQNVALFVARDTVDIPALQDPARMRHVNAANFMFRQMRMK